MIYLYYKVGFIAWILWVLFVVKNFDDAKEKIMEVGLPVFLIVSFLFVSVWIFFVTYFAISVIKDIFRRITGK